ncbi:class I SAM-dependent methyltransferase [Chloroflexota bacterium]
MTDPHHHHNSDRINMLDDEGRRKWLRVDDLIKESGVRKGMTCIDLGCGAGALSIPLAAAIGKEGTVYAVDISKEILDRLISRNPPENVKPVNKGAAETGLESAIADYCFIILVLHEVQPDNTLTEAYRLLKPDGKVIAMEWRTDIETMGPPLNERISPDELEQLFNRAGFINYKYKDWTKGQYIATGIKDNE